MSDFEDEMDDSERLFYNGIDGRTGKYLFDPVSAADLANVAQGREIDPDHLLDLQDRASNPDHYGTIEGINQKHVEEAGWGVVFALGDERTDAIKEALAPLLQHRKKQAQKNDERRYKEYTGVAAYRPGKESKQDFLGRHGAAPGPANPDKVPYYLLLVGDPKSIPYRFQYQLDVQYAVGRIWFDTIEEYAQYAHSVVEAETGGLALPRRGAFWGVNTKGDRATELSSEHLIAPLHQWATGDQPSWAFDSYIGPNKATKSQLASLLGGKQTPAFLFSASHGMGFPKDDPLQLPHQGALLTQDWAGPGQGISRDHYFSGEDLDSSMNLLGLIAFFFACYGGGTPEFDEFYKIANKSRSAVAPYPFVANLPRQLLNRPKGGALAVVGHVERAWGYSFMWERAGRSLESFQSTLKRLLEGHPIGSAIEPFNERYAEMASDLSVELEDVDAGATPNVRKLATAWTSSNDARGWAVIGDPAVKLMVADAGAAATLERPTITAVTPAKPKTEESSTTTFTTSVVTTTVETTATGGENSGATEFGIGDLFRGKEKEPTPEGGVPAPSGFVASLQEFGTRLGHTLKQAAEDVASLEVRTFVSDDVKGAGAKYDHKNKDPFGDSASLRAMTHISLDGDIDVLIPRRANDIDEQLWTIHKDMVEQALEHRTKMIELLTNAAASLINPIK
ncbi:MAG: hypothetical protein KA338_22395 [Chloroflexi bacterium]|nr:hypothetical protein [Chloroflexota bacterium]